MLDSDIQAIVQNTQTFWPQFEPVQCTLQDAYFHEQPNEESGMLNADGFTTNSKLAAWGISHNEGFTWYYFITAGVKGWCKASHVKIGGCLALLKAAGIALLKGRWQYARK
jgi:hypothetical protein